MATINITCNCGVTTEVPRTNEIPSSAISMGCNWCPACENTAEEYYEEWYNYPEPGEKKEPIPIADNQLCLPFEIEFINDRVLVK